MIQEGRSVRALYRRRYDRAKHQYEPSELIPADWTVLQLTADMDRTTNCVDCGKPVPFGDTYASQQWYEESGVWALPVCPDCHRKEMIERGLRP